MARTRQPTGSIRVDLGNTLARGLVAAVTPSACLYDAQSKQFLALDSGVASTFGPDGIGYDFDGSSTGLTLPLSMSGPYSFIALAISTTTSGTRNIFSLGSGAGYSTQMRISGSDWQFYHKNGTSGSDLLAGESGAVSSGSIARIGGTWDGSSTHTFYRDGVQRGSNGTSTLQAPITSLHIGEDNFGAKQAWQGSIYFVGIWNRRLTSGEVFSASKSPWQLFAPQRRPWIQLGAAAGGPAIYNDSVSESGSAADTPSALGLYVGAHSETATALDVKSAVTSAVAAAAETASAADTQTAIATLVATAAETASAVDTTSATSTSSGTAEAAEAATAVDAPSAIATLLATGAEIASALDTATSIYSTAATVAESASGAESTDGTVIPVGASLCVETASAADTVTCVIVTAGSVAEGTASATDVCAAGGIWNDFVTETVTAVDTQSSIEPISAIPPDVSRRIDNSTVRVGSSKIDRGSTRLG